MTAAHVALEKGNTVSARAANGRVYSGTVVDVVPSNDIALIRLRGYSGITVNPARNACLETGNFIYSLGRPHDQGNTVRVGSVQSTSFGRPVAYGKFGYPDAIVLELGTEKGESGGPLFNESGRIRGHGGEFRPGRRQPLPQHGPRHPRPGHRARHLPQCGVLRRLAEAGAVPEFGLQVAVERLACATGAQLSRAVADRVKLIAPYATAANA